MFTVPVSVPPGAACETVAHAAVCTVATAVYELFPVLGSGGVPESVMTAVLAYAPAALALTVTVMVAVAPLARGVGSVQFTGPVPVQVVPPLATAEIKAGPAASVSASVTPLAADGPLLVTVMV